VYVAQCGLNVIVSGNVLQCKGVGVLSGLGQKGMTKSVQASVGMGRDLLPDLSILRAPKAREDRLTRRETKQRFISVKPSTTAVTGLPHSKQLAFNRDVINPQNGHILCD
jgi:hypothetical protein